MKYSFKMYPMGISLIIHGQFIGWFRYSEDPRYYSPSGWRRRSSPIDEDSQSYKEAWDYINAHYDKLIEEGKEFKLKESL